ncbi:MAG: type I 3-dehydroquinate dehydratase [Phycisphaerales bacterium]
MTLLCASIPVENAEAALRHANTSKKRGADLVEFRFDAWHLLAEVLATDAAKAATLARNLISDSPLPVIATFRSQDEGGISLAEYSEPVYDEDARIEFLANLAFADYPRGTHPPRFVDIEHAAMPRVLALAPSRNNLEAQHETTRPGLILSHHNLAHPPRNISRLLLEMRDQSVTCSPHFSSVMLKFAFRARNLHDALEALAIPASLDLPTTALAMGDLGTLSRVLAPKFGVAIAYAGLTDQTLTAHGQLALDALIHTHAFRTIDARTRVFGIVGDPVAHSRSPAFHNDAFARANLNARLVPIRIAGDADADAETSYISFKAGTLELLAHPTLDFRGMAVTAPHKENLVRLAIEEGWTIDDSARAIGAANTMWRHSNDGCPSVTNTDARAIVSLLGLEPGTWQGRRIGVIGAGGFARAAVWAGTAAEAEVLVVNRSRTRAERLVGEVGNGLARVGTIADLAGVSALVQATSADLLNLPGLGSAGVAEIVSRLGPETVMLESIYDPERTEFVLAGESRGLQVITGSMLFEAQARVQFSECFRPSAG